MMGPRMPSPIGHALAGIAVAWAADLVPADRAWRTAPAMASWYLRAGGGLTLLCAGLGAAPDLDLAFRCAPDRHAQHRRGARRRPAVPRRSPPDPGGRSLRIALMCAGAYGSHLLWTGSAWTAIRRAASSCCGRSISEWYISELDIFRQTARLRIFTRGPMLTNVRAILQEIAILVPILAALWLVRVKALARFAPEMARSHHPPE